MFQVSIALAVLAVGLVWSIRDHSEPLVNVDLGLTATDISQDLIDGFERRDG